MSKHHQSPPSSSAFFQIPFLPPLLTNTYNIPAPVIYPPGTDPRSFLNTKTPHGQVLEKASSMDVDPCVVASRREIIVEKTGLSESEHAGVALSEATTIVSTTSNYHTNPAFVATKTESKNHNLVVPDTYNVTCNNELHDLKNTQNPVVSSTSSINQETPSSVANDSLDQESAKKNQDLLKSLFVCNIPEPDQDYPKIATLEADESLLKNWLSNPGSQERPPKCFEGEQQLTTWCEICKVSCSSNIDYNIHASGRKHNKNLQKLPNLPSTVIDSVTVEKLNQGNFSRCELCGVCCNSLDLFNEHFLGKKHQKKLKYEKQCVPSAEPVAPGRTNKEGEVVFSERSKRKGDDSSADTKRQKMNEVEEGCGVLVICKKCNVVYNGFMAYKTHSCQF